MIGTRLRSVKTCTPYSCLKFSTERQDLLVRSNAKPLMCEKTLRTCYLKLWLISSNLSAPGQSTDSSRALSGTSVVSNIS